MLSSAESSDLEIEVSPAPESHEAAPPSFAEPAAAEQDTRDPDDIPPAPSNSEEQQNSNGLSAESSPYIRLGAWNDPAPQSSGPQALVQALRAGQLERAESLFGTMSGLKAEKLKEVFYGNSGRYLALACRALGFDQLQFASTLILSRKLGLEEADGDAAAVSSASELFQETEPKKALEVLQRWRSG